MKPTLAKTLTAAGLLALCIAAPASHAEQVPALDPQQLKALVHQLVGEELKAHGLDDAGMDTRIEQGIRNYVHKRQQEQQQAQAAAGQRARRKARNVRPIAADDHVYGDPKAPFSLIEYSDFECPFCKRFNANPQKLVDQNPGKVNWVYRHFPLSFHNPGSETEARASECAAEQGGNDAFWKFAGRIYERTKSNGKGFPIRNLQPLAEEIGLDGDKFKQCLDSGRFTDRIKRDLADGTRAGVNGTPGSFLRDNKTGDVAVIRGAQPYEQLVNALHSLEKAAAPD